MTHLEIVKEQLLLTGKVSRNWLLRNYITRGASRISDLRRLGLDIEGGFVETEYGKDYVYTLKNMEIKKEPEPMTDDEKIRRWKPTIGNGKHVKALEYRRKYLEAVSEQEREFWRVEFFKTI